jgi:hypothetical protein
MPPAFLKPAVQNFLFFDRDKPPSLRRERPGAIAPVEIILAEP